ncbi:TATA-binding protein-associated factor mot1 [Tulasnella sp. 418]|nr:TATA-binding protein-associated factor mot1 [Tulasnella sp. 418]
MSSRLDRLLLLLDSGASPAVRAAAARQIAQIAAKSVNKDVAADSGVESTSAHTHVWHTPSSDWTEVMAVVSRILPYLQSKSFETRSAASNALCQLCTLVPIWKPNTPRTTPTINHVSTTAPPFPPFSVSDLIGPPHLLSSTGKEFNKLPHNGRDAANAKRDAMGKLGLGLLEGFGGDALAGELEKELVDDGDTDVKMEETKSEQELTTDEPPTPAPTAGKIELKVEAKEESISAQNLSARERNRLKRKRKEGNAFVGAVSGASAAQMVKNLAAAPQPTSKVRVVETENGPSAKPSAPSPSPETGVSGEKVVIDPSKGGQVAANEKGTRSVALEIKDGHWIWEAVVDVLANDLTNPNWEIRHGAAMALREIIKAQGAAGGMLENVSEEENAFKHEEWCIQLASRFLYVFIKDRFSDFVSDQMVAPVRETVSQSLASLLLHMPRRSILHVHEILREMIIQSNESNRNGHVNGNRSGGLRGGPQDVIGHVWPVRHSGLLGMKYEVAVREDLVDGKEQGSQDVLKGVIQAAMIGLQDSNDDVRSVAATCLTPIVKQIVERTPEELAQVMDVIWQCLGDMKDDLGSSVGSVMDLLGKLVEFPQVTTILADGAQSRPLNALAPALFPFFRHTIPNVRLAVVNTLCRFLSAQTLSDDWISQPFLRLLFQNLIVEERTDIREATFHTWKLAMDSLSKDPNALRVMVTETLLPWFTVLMNPLGVPLDPSLFYKPSGVLQLHNVDKPVLAQDFSLVSEEAVLRGRVSGAKAIAYALSVWPPEVQSPDFHHYLTFYDQSRSWLQRFLASVIIQEWAMAADATTSEDPPLSITIRSPLASELANRLIAFIESNHTAIFHEQIPELQRLNNDCRTLLQTFATETKAVPPNQADRTQIPTALDLDGNDPDAFSIDVAKAAVTEKFDFIKSHLGRSKRKEVAAAEEKRQKIQVAIQRYEAARKVGSLRVSACAAAAIVALRVRPEKLNPLIHGIMDGTKFEENIDLQERFALSVVAFTVFCAPLSLSTKVNPAEKIVKNICTFICADDTLTPILADNLQLLKGITSIKKPVIQRGSSKKAAEVKQASEDQPRETVAKRQRRGALMALANFGERFGASLFDKLPKLWECMTSGLIAAYPSEEPVAEDGPKGQAVIDNLTVIQGAAPHLHPDLLPRIAALFPRVISALRSQFAVIRQTAARCFASLCDVFTVDAMRYVVEHIIPLLGDSLSVTNRQGAMELISNVVQLLDIKALPYVIFLIVPVLGRMSDSDDDVRFAATNTFASLVKMVPLEAGLPDPPGFSDEMLSKRETERQFLTQLLDGSKVEPYKLPVTINAELRPYQQDGVNWLAFLAKYQLHGILCDDMGLGKTLQSICILASKHHERAEKWKAEKSPDAVHLPSLIICPPTLTGHWYHEILKYANSLRPVQYVGPARERTKLLPGLKQYDIVITSYDVVRNDISNLAPISWHYCILDEGHVIKNNKTMLTRAVKSIKANHRLVLSGTPIQNNVLELWSLFDFLMPGFLGTESSFNERFGKPILANRDSKGGAKTAEAAAIALEALHKQVLPFLLRRLKEDVLSDLPPKIIQDYYCELSDIQKIVYDDFTQSQARQQAEAALHGGDGGKSGGGQQHVFQSLQYLRKLCNHPALVIKDEATLNDLLAKHKLTLGPAGLRDVVHAPKIEALRQLLSDCGIGSSKEEETASESATVDATLSQHRVLIFCQMKQMIDMIETDLFQALMPEVTYMRLDGTVDLSKRHAIVQTFNSDPSIDCLLLTTQVGGLGLTLTGADTVIFVEHDWNPMKDLQAMDRAHRLGQKKVVNVYRLITKGTLEEKIMGLQRFKLNIANSVITQQNAGLSSMDTDLVLDLFRRTTDDEDAAAKKKAAAANSGPVSQKNVLEGLEDLPPEEEYESLDLSNFMGSLGR